MENIKYLVDTPTFLRIGDPSYLEEPTPNRKKLIFESTFPKDFVSSVRIEKFNEDGFVQISICIAPHNELLTLYEKGMSYKFLSHEEQELGCDTACFVIETENDSDEICTMSDGYYGSAHKFTNIKGENYGVIILLSIDSDVYDEGITNTIKYLFKEKKNEN